MRRHGLRARWKRKFTHTTDSKHQLPVAENVLNRQFQPEQANRAWVGDITYVRTRQRLALPGRGARSVLAQGGRLGNGPTYASVFGL